MTLMRRLAHLQRGEAAIALLAAVQFYLILTCLMVLRPAQPPKMVEENDLFVVPAQAGTHQSRGTLPL